MFDYVNWAGVENGVGSNGVGELDVDRLNKALSAGTGAGYGATGGRGLIYEDLEAEFRTTTYGEKQFDNCLFKVLQAKAVEAESTVHEFTQVTDYGTTGALGPEINTVMNATDTAIQRQFANVKFFRSKRQLSHVIDFTKGGNRAFALQFNSGAKFITSSVEQYLFCGDSAMSPDEWDGTIKLAVNAGQSQDLRGATISKTSLNFVCGNIAGLNNYGTPSHLFGPIRQQTGMDNVLQGANDRIIFNPAELGYSPVQNAGYNEGQSHLAGSPAAGFRSSFGNVKFSCNNFTQFRPVPYVSPITNTETYTNTLFSASVPTGLAATPTATGATGFNTTGIGGAQTNGGYSNGYNGSYAGAYTYRVSAGSSAGESICCAAVTATVVALGKITLAWDSMPNATFYNIYRSRCGAGASDVTLITRVAASITPGAGAEGYVDINQNIAGCDTIVVMDLVGAGESASVGMADLAPLTKYDLPMLDTVYQFMMFKYTAFTPYNMKKVYVLRNVGAAV